MTFLAEKKLPGSVMFTKQDLGYKASKSNAMKSLMQDKTMSGILNQSAERQEFFAALKKQTGGNRSVKKDDVRKVLGDFRSGKGRTVDKSEAQKMASHLFGGSTGNKYIFTAEEKSVIPGRKRNMNVSERNSALVSPRHGSPSLVKGGNSTGATNAARPRFF